MARDLALHLTWPAHLAPAQGTPPLQKGVLLSHRYVHCFRLCRSQSERRTSTRDHCVASGKDRQGPLRPFPQSLQRKDALILVLLALWQALLQCDAGTAGRLYPIMHTNHTTVRYRSKDPKSSQDPPNRRPRKLEATCRSRIERAEKWPL